jgi:hypothetical protein
VKRVRSSCSIWNARIRENTSLNWAGETQDPLAVYIDSALGIGAITDAFGPR